MTREKLKKLFPICIFLIFIVLFIYIGFVYNDYRTSLINAEHKSQNFDELEWMFIKSIIYEDYLAAENQAKIVAKNITNQLHDEYPDLKVLQTDLEAKHYDSDPTYFKILRSSIRDIYLFGVENHDNDIFICDRNGILIDLSLADSSKEFPYTWDKYFEKQSNPLLAARAVELIFQQSNGLIYWEQNNDDKLQIPNTVNIENLQRLYQLYGIDAFKNIQFLAPAYITNTGDIFGIDDIDIHGVTTNNHKIAVVQTFNLYQQLTTRYAGEVEKIKSFKMHTITNPINDLHTYVIFIILIVSIVSILIFFILIFTEKK